MDDYVISCCSTADISEEHFRNRGLQYICFHYVMNGKEYTDDLGKTITFQEFYKAMRCGAATRAVSIRAEEFERYFDSFLQKGQDVLHVCLSSGISDVIRSAMTARNRLEERYPERKIFILDSFGASSGYGLFMDRLAELRAEGKTIDELYDWARANRLKLHHWFFSTDLDFYVRSGSVSKTAGFVGGVLGLCPLLNVDNRGRLIPRDRIHTKKKAIAELVKRMEEYAADGLNYSGKCYISQSACYGDAREVADRIEERFPKLDGGVEINTIGTTVGSHTGPGTVALFFWGNDRTE